MFIYDATMNKRSFTCKDCWQANIYKITVVLKVETDIITIITANPIT